MPKGWQNESIEEKELASGGDSPYKKEVSKTIRDLSIIRVVKPEKFLIFNKQLLSKVLGFAISKLNICER